MKPARVMRAHAVWIALVLVAGVRPALGDASADQAAAQLVYPYITVDSAAGTDTLLQISNTSSTPVVVRCFYEIGVADSFYGIVVTTVEFAFQLTSQQPIAWRASHGLVTFPLDGVNRVGPGGAANEDSQIPPVPSDPSVGLLRCIAVDRNLVPVERNVLIGSATLGQRRSPGDSFTDATEYRAIGIQAHSGAGNGDDSLVVGGPNAEYDACPNFSVIPHFFDGALEPAGRSSSVSTTLVVIPCSDDLAQGLIGKAVVMYEVFNEFEQRFGTSQPLEFQQVSALSAIGGVANPDRSIFNVQVAGTLTGQTRMQSADGSGVLALAIETHHDLSDPTRVRRAAFTAHRLGTRAQADTVVLPQPSTPSPTLVATRTATPTATRPVPTVTPTATATASPTRTLIPTSTATVTPPAPSPTRTAAQSNGSSGCSVAMQQPLDSTTACTLLLGPALAVLRRRRARRE